MKINLSINNINKAQSKSFNSLSKGKENKEEYYKKNDKIENINTFAMGFGLVGLYLENKGSESLKKTGAKVFKLAGEDMTKTRLAGIACLITSIGLMVYSCIKRRNNADFKGENNEVKFSK